MKNLLIILISIVFLASCASKSTKNTVKEDRVRALDVEGSIVEADAPAGTPCDSPAQWGIKQLRIKYATESAPCSGYETDYEVQTTTCEGDGTSGGTYTWSNWRVETLSIDPDTGIHTYGPPYKNSADLFSFDSCNGGAAAARIFYDISSPKDTACKPVIQKRDTTASEWVFFTEPGQSAPSVPEATIVAWNYQTAWSLMTMDPGLGGVIFDIYDNQIPYGNSNYAYDPDWSQPDVTVKNTHMNCEVQFPTCDGTSVGKIEYRTRYISNFPSKQDLQLPEVPSIFMKYGYQNHTSCEGEVHHRTCTSPEVGVYEWSPWILYSSSGDNTINFKRFDYCNDPDGGKNTGPSNWGGVGNPCHTKQDSHFDYSTIGGVGLSGGNNPYPFYQSYGILFRASQEIFLGKLVPHNGKQARVKYKRRYAVRDTDNLENPVGKCEGVIQDRTCTNGYWGKWIASSHFSLNPNNSGFEKLHYGTFIEDDCEVPDHLVDAPPADNRCPPAKPNKVDGICYADCANGSSNPPECNDCPDTAPVFFDQCAATEADRTITFENIGAPGAGTEANPYGICNLNQLLNIRTERNAFKEINDIIFEARAGGTAGNAIQIEVTDAGDDAPTTVSVSGNKITVNIDIEEDFYCTRRYDEIKKSGSGTVEQQVFDCSVYSGAGTDCSEHSGAGKAGVCNAEADCTFDTDSDICINVNADVCNARAECVFETSNVCKNSVLFTTASADFGSGVDVDDYLLVEIEAGDKRFRVLEVINANTLKLNSAVEKTETNRSYKVARNFDKQCSAHADRGTCRGDNECTWREDIGGRCYIGNRDRCLAGDPDGRWRPVIPQRNIADAINRCKRISETNCRKDSECIWEWQNSSCTSPALRKVGVASNNYVEAASVLPPTNLVGGKDGTNYLDKHFVLLKDIDNTDDTDTRSMVDDTGVGFPPIGECNLLQRQSGYLNVECQAGAERPFTGSFDGNNHTIENMYMRRHSRSLVGLFGYTRNADIKNLKIKNLEIEQAGSIVGGLIGQKHNGTVSNVHVMNSTIAGGYSNYLWGGTSSLRDNFLGGIVGRQFGGTIEDSSSESNTFVYGPNMGRYSGGIVGYQSDRFSKYKIDSSSKVIRSFSSTYKGGIWGAGSLVGQQYYAGGVEESYGTRTLVGSTSYSDIEKSYSSSGSLYSHDYNSHISSSYSLNRYSSINFNGLGFERSKVMVQRSYEKSNPYTSAQCGALTSYTLCKAPRAADDSTLNACYWRDNTCYLKSYSSYKLNGSSTGVSEYFTFSAINSSGVEIPYYVWFNSEVDGVFKGKDPITDTTCSTTNCTPLSVKLAGKTGIQVLVEHAFSGEEVADALMDKLNTELGDDIHATRSRTYETVYYSGEWVEIQALHAGDVENISKGNLSRWDHAERISNGYSAWSSSIWNWPSGTGSPSLQWQSISAAPEDPKRCILDCSTENIDPTYCQDYCAGIGETFVPGVGCVEACYPDCNQAPQVQNPVFTVLEDTTLTDNVVSTMNGGCETGNCVQDPDGDSLTILMTSNTPKFGELNPYIASNGDFEYVPFEHLNDTTNGAPETFGFRVCDNGFPQKCTNGTVTINITPDNDTPAGKAQFIIVDGFAIGGAQTEESGQLEATDVDDTDLTFTLDTDGAKGDAAINTAGDFIYFPDPDVTGVDSFIFEVCDDESACSKAQVDVYINPPPAPAINLCFAKLNNDNTAYICDSSEEKSYVKNPCNKTSVTKLMAYTFTPGDLDGQTVSYDFTYHNGSSPVTSQAPEADVDDVCSRNDIFCYCPGGCSRFSDSQSECIAQPGCYYVPENLPTGIVAECKEAAYIKGMLTEIKAEHSTQESNDLRMQRLERAQAKAEVILISNHQCAGTRGAYPHVNIFNYEDSNFNFSSQPTLPHQDVLDDFAPILFYENTGKFWVGEDSSNDLYFECSSSLFKLDGRGPNSAFCASLEDWYCGNSDRDYDFIVTYEDVDLDSMSSRIRLSFLHTTGFGADNYLKIKLKFDDRAEREITTSVWKGGDDFNAPDPTDPHCLPGSPVPDNDSYCPDQTFVLKIEEDDYIYDQEEKKFIYYLQPYSNKKNSRGPEEIIPKAKYLCHGSEFVPDPTHQEGAILIDVVKEGSSPNNDPIADNIEFNILQGVEFEEFMPGFDIDRTDFYTYSIVTNGTKGTATILDETDGNFKYDPTAASGVDTFTYMLNDQKKDSNTATITINIQAVDPAVICASTDSETNVDTYFRYNGGSGTEANPYEICNQWQFKQITLNSGDWDKHFVLTQHIDLTGMILTPIGDELVAFTGVFDGQGFSIIGFEMNELFASHTVTPVLELRILGEAFAQTTPTADDFPPYTAIFGNMDSGVLRNIYIKDCVVYGGDNTSCLVGYTYGGKLVNVSGENCRVYAMGDNVAVLVGDAQMTILTNVTVNNAYVQGNSQVNVLTGTQKSCELFTKYSGSIPQECVDSMSPGYCTDGTWLNDGDAFNMCNFFCDSYCNIDDKSFSKNVQILEFSSTGGGDSIVLFSPDGEFDANADVERECISAKFRKEISGTWTEAFLSTDYKDIEGIVPSSMRTGIEVVGPGKDRKLISSDWNALWDGSIDMTLFSAGVLESGDEWWSGSVSSGENSSQNCENWSDNTSSYTGTVGRANSWNSNWINYANRTCNLKKRIICVAW